jgi:hypothetical protein
MRNHPVLFRRAGKDGRGMVLNLDFEDPFEGEAENDG